MWKRAVNGWFNHFLNSRAEFCLIFRSFFGQWSFKKKCVWDLLTFSLLPFPFNTLIMIRKFQHIEPNVILLRLILQESRSKVGHFLKTTDKLVILGGTLTQPSSELGFADYILIIWSWALKTHSPRTHNLVRTYYYLSFSIFNPFFIFR